MSFDHFLDRSRCFEFIYKPVKVAQDMGPFCLCNADCLPDHHKGRIEYSQVLMSLHVRLKLLPHTCRHLDTIDTAASNLIVLTIPQ